MTTIAIKILFVSLGVLLIVILYKLLIRRFSRGRVIHSNFCTLYSLEQNPSKDTVEFYFICPTTIEVEFFIVDSNEQTHFSKKESFEKGGHIIRFDTNKLKDGDYIYGIRTYEQETLKKMQIKNN